MDATQPMIRPSRSLRGHGFARWATIGVLLAASLAGSTPVTAGPGPLPTFANGSAPGQVAMLTEEGLLHTGPLTGPAAFLTAPDGRLFVADTLNQRILLVDPAGQTRLAIDLSGLERRAGLDQPPLVCDLALAGPSQLYLADAANLTVLVVDLATGYQRRFGRGGTRPGEFLQINRIRADADGNAFVEDAATQKTLVFRRDGVLLAEIPGVTNAAVDRDGRLHQPVFEGNPRERAIEVFDRTGRSRGILGRISDPLEISLITCLGFDGEGNLHVAYSTDLGRNYAVMGPDGRVRQTRRHPAFDIGLDVTTPEWVAPDGRILTIKASSQQLAVRELSF